MKTVSVREDDNGSKVKENLASYGAGDAPEERGT